MGEGTGPGDEVRGREAGGQFNSVHVLIMTVIIRSKCPVWDTLAPARVIPLHFPSPHPNLILFSLAHLHLLSCECDIGVSNAGLTLP